MVLNGSCDIIMLNRQRIRKNGGERPGSGWNGREGFQPAFRLLRRYDILRNEKE
jgi:hypothetical protein